MKHTVRLAAALLGTVLLIAPAAQAKIVEQPAPQLVARTQSLAPLEQKLGATWLYFEGRTLSAHSAFVYDCEEEEYLFMLGSPQTQVFPASVTKLFTTYVMLQLLQPQKTVTAGDALTLVRSNSSVAGIKKGDTLTVEQLIQGMLLPSGNDATCILAVEAGRKLAEDETLPCEDAVALFMEEVNRRAKEEGLTGTHFVTPDG